MTTTNTFYEFFAGGGMARLGLGRKWACLFANEWCEKKAAAYTAHFGKGSPKACDELKVRDVAGLSAKELPGQPDLIWASFPCQDLSLAGAGAGLLGTRSGTFKPFWKLVSSLIDEGRGPSLIVLENVGGTLTSHGGKDFSHIMGCLSEGGYRAGAMMIDALRFVPQSRPRLFFVAVRSDMNPPKGSSLPFPSPAWHSASLQEAYGNLNAKQKSAWIWWSMPEPESQRATLTDLLEDQPHGVKWHTEAQTKKLVAMMSDRNRLKLRLAQEEDRPIAGTIYKRTRPDRKTGEKVQRAEVRFDGIAGCLRTPAGGSSRQIVLLVNGDSVRSRLLSPRELARLMGVPEKYPLPDNYNEAYHLFGDGLAVPVVSWLSEQLLIPLAAKTKKREVAA